MKQLEIIHLRLTGESVKALSGEILDSLKGAGPGIEAITLYRRQELETDVAIHIRHVEGHDSGRQSRLGLRLASALKAYGLVEHTLWEEHQ